MTVTINESISAGGTTYSVAKQLTPSDEVITLGTIAVSNGSTDAAWSLGGIDVSQAVAVYFSSDQSVTLETNSTDATGGNTISLGAGGSYLWYTGKADSLALTADVTSTIYVTNASGSTANVKCMAVQDGSP